MSPGGPPVSLCMIEIHMSARQHFKNKITHVSICLVYVTANYVSWGTGTDDAVSRHFFIYTLGSWSGDLSFFSPANVLNTMWTGMVFIGH